MYNMMRIKRRKKAKTLTLILIMMLAIASSIAWLFFGYGKQMQDNKNAAKIIVKSLEEGRKSLSDATNISEDIILAEHIFSHRGSGGIYEHSFKAYDAAIEAGSRYIEQDIVMSSDGVLFVAHDLNASYMTGRNAEYSSTSAAEIEQLETNAGFKVLRLSEVFDKYGKDINYIIEFKDSDESMETAFGKLVDEYDYQDNIIVQSYYTEVLENLEDKYPDMPKLAICKTQGDVENSLNLEYVDIISVKYDARLMTEDNCEAAHSRGKKFGVWTINREASIRDAIEMDVDNYFTDDTALALSLEKKYRSKS